MVVAISTSLTAKSGILIRNRRAFEMVRNVNAVVFDKTGTLTMGKFEVSDIISFIDEEDLLKFTSSVEFNSEHIIATAIVEYAKDRGVETPQAEEFKALLGRGAYGKIDGREVYVGSPNLLKEFGITVEDPRIKRLQEQGKTVVFTVVDKNLAGAFALSDKVREESREAVKRVERVGNKGLHAHRRRRAGSQMGGRRTRYRRLFCAVSS